MRQCPSCGGDCGYLKDKGCQYGKKTLPDMLTPQEHQEIVRIVALIGAHATEAAIEAYLLGQKLSDNAWVGLPDDDGTPWDGVDAKSFAQAIGSRTQGEEHHTIDLIML